MESSSTGTGDGAVGIGADAETVSHDNRAVDLVLLLSNDAPMERVDSATKTEEVNDDAGALLAASGTCP